HIERALREAIAGLENDIAAFPKNAETDSRTVSDDYVRLGHVYRQLGEIEKADAAFRQGVETFEKQAASGDPMAMKNLAWLLATAPDVQVRDPAKAVEWAQKAVAAAPTIRHTTLGVAQYRAGRINDSIATLEKSMQMTGGGDPFDWLFLAM